MKGKSSSVKLTTAMVDSPGGFRAPNAESVFDLLNVASRRLQEGRFTEAMFLFVQSLRCLAALPVDSHARNDADEEEEELAERFALSLISVQANALNEQWQPEQSPHNAGFLLYDSIFVTVLREASQIRDPNDKKFVMAFVFYNLALCIVCKECQAERTTASEFNEPLNVAKHFFVRALEHLDQYHDASNESEDVLLLRLALYNNLGFYYQRNGDESSASRCARQIETLVRAPRNGLWTMNSDDWDFFTLTAIVRRFGLCWAAPRSKGRRLK